jgi:flagella basal body P-ring formation protein FlgA
MLSALAFVALSSAVAAPSSSFEDWLRAELQQRYPRVARWDIRALGDEIPAASGEREIIHAGSRTLVRVGERRYWYAVSGFAAVVSIEHYIHPGTALTESDGVVIERNVLASDCTPLDGLAALNHQQARRPLRAHEIVCREAIEPRPPVTRGAIVKVHYAGSRLSLITTARALSDGRLGDMLWLENPRSRERFSAHVTGTNEVSVDD